MAVVEQDIVLISKDQSGNTVIKRPFTSVDQVEGAVKTVNGEMPDENGNVSVTMPQAVQIKVYE